MREATSVPQGLVASGGCFSSPGHPHRTFTRLPYLQRRQLLTFIGPLGPEAEPHFHAAARGPGLSAPLPVKHVTQWASFVGPLHYLTDSLIPLSGQVPFRPRQPRETPRASVEAQEVQRSRRFNWK